MIDIQDFIHSNNSPILACHLQECHLLVATAQHHPIVPKLWFHKEQVAYAVQHQVSHFSNGIIIDQTNQYLYQQTAITVNSVNDKDSSSGAGDNHSWGLLRGLRKNYSSANLRQAAKEETLRETSLDSTSLYGMYPIPGPNLFMLTNNYVRISFGQEHITQSSS